MKRGTWCHLFVVCGLLLAITSAPADADGDTWTPTGSLNSPRGWHTATLLSDGRVLVAGGLVSSGVTDSAELYDSPTGQWAATGAMTTARDLHTATRLLDGRVLVAGGYGLSSRLSSVEIFDPTLGQWAATGSLGDAREDHTATLLPDGRVLVVGGYSGSSVLASVEIYDPATGQWSPTGSLGTARASHTATLLNDGRVMVAGGRSSGDQRLASVEMYDAATGQWTYTGSLDIARDYFTATLLPDGRVLAAGGRDWAVSRIRDSEVYDPSTGEWMYAGWLAVARAFHAAALLPNGAVLVVGGGSDAYENRTAETYLGGDWTLTDSLNDGRPHGHTATLTAGGCVLVAGGYEYGNYISSAELYGPVPCNAPPVAADDTYATTEDTPLTAPAPGVLSNDSDADGDLLAAVLDASPGSGTLDLHADGSFTYAPAPDDNGLVTFTYHANDGIADSNVALVTIAISPVNDAPLAADDAYFGNEDMPLAVPAPGVLANDTDADGDLLAAILDTPPGSGTMDLSADGSFTYQPAPGFVGAVTFTYHARDGEANSNVAVVTVSITPANHTPVAVDDAYSVLIDTLLAVGAPGVLANDTDADGDPLTAMLDAPPSKGALSLSADGSFTYVPELGFTGVVTFTYSANDGMAGSQPVEVRLTVAPVSVYLPFMARGHP